MGYPTSKPAHDRDHGFSLVEMVVVVLIIGIIAAIAIPVYLNQREKAAKATTRANMRNLVAEVVTARENTQKSLPAITGSGWSVGQCNTLDPLPKVTDLGFTTTACGVRWVTAANNLAAAAGTSPEEIKRLMTDGWGRPMLFDENEGEGGDCSRIDTVQTAWIGSGWPSGKGINYQIPLGGFC